MAMETPHSSPSQREPEHQGPAWKHPYAIYIVLTIVLFLFIVGMGWIALENDWIPKR